MRALTIAAVVALIASIVLAFLSRSTIVTAVALTLGGCACVLGVCLAFYAVGRGEDEQRARDQLAREQRERDEGPAD